MARAAQFMAIVSNDSANMGVTWTLTGAGCSGASCGSVSSTSTASGVATTYTAPGGVPNPASVTLTATSVADPTKTASATITITAAPSPISVQLSATSATLLVSTTSQFTATVQNDAQNNGVTWNLSGAGCSGATCGSLFPATTVSGVATTYTAPVSVPNPATVMLTATSVADSSKSATATITLAAASGLTLIVDPNTRFQTWEGWRASATGPQFTSSCGFRSGCSTPVPDSVLNNILDDLVFDVGLSGLRFGPNPRQAPKTVNPASLILVTVNGVTYDFTKTWINPDFAVQDGLQFVNKILLPMKQRVESRGDTFTTAIVGGYHYADLDTAMHTPTGMADFAEAYATWFQQAAGFYPTYMAVTNEPQPGFYTSGEIYNDIVAMGQRFVARGIPTKIEAPEDPTPYTPNVQSILATAGALPVIGVISFHGYDYGGGGSATPPDFTSRNQIRDLARLNNLRTAMTEVANDGSFHTSWNGSYAQALGWARDIYWNMTEANISVWEPEAMMFPCGPADSTCANGEQDIIAIYSDLSNYRKQANYYGMRQFSHYIRPGDTRVGVNCSGCTSGSLGLNLKPVAFKSAAGKITVVVVNDQNSDQTISILGLPAGTYNITGVTPQATTGVTPTTQTVSAGQSLVLTMPAQGILTVEQK